MFINVDAYKNTVKERRELLENQCNSATSHQEYKQYVADHKVCHFELLNSVKQRIRNAKFLCMVETVGIWVLLTGCAYCGVLPYTVVYLLWLPLFVILLYACKLADKELAELICVYETEV